MSFVSRYHRGPQIQQADPSRYGRVSTGLQDESSSPDPECSLPERNPAGRKGSYFDSLTRDFAVQHGDHQDIPEKSTGCGTDEESGWKEAPRELMVIIFAHLTVKDIGSCAQTCQNWKQLLELDAVWKLVFSRDYRVKQGLRLRSIQEEKSFLSWREEYRHLWCDVPAIQAQLIRDHRDEVLHVSFSHNGAFFATCSKDGYVKCWDAFSFPVVRRHQANMKEYSWKYTQWSAFNCTDTLLLVSGVHLGPVGTSGELVVFNIENDFALQSKVRNKPYDIFGSWLDSAHLFSGNLHFTGAMESCCSLWISTASQELESERLAVIRRAYKFRNVNGSSLRTLVVARPYGPLDQNLLLIFSTGTLTFIPHQIGIKKIKLDEVPFPGTTVHRTLQEAIADHERQLVAALGGHQAPNIEYDSMDHVLELNAQIIGLALSPDQRFLFANCRRWPENVKISDPFFPPPISSEIEIRCFDLHTMEQVSHTYRAHRAFTPSEECFFIFIDISRDFVASGAENSSGYIWDRHRNITLSSLIHNSVVNSVAFNPADQEQLVSVSDDYTIRVWFSRRKCRELGLPFWGQKIYGVDQATQVQCHVEVADRTDEDFFPSENLFPSLAD